jgi:DNA-binding NarL/FixJ family response regulator
MRGVDRARAVAAHAERVAGLGSWEWTPATGELVWSENLYRLYGLEPWTLVPTAEWVVARVHTDDRPFVEASLAELAVGLPLEIEYRWRMEDGGLRFLRATVAIVEETDDQTVRIVGSVQDVTAHRQLERETRARLAAGGALDGWRSFDEGAVELLAGISQAMGFVLGTVWVWDAGGFESRAMWHVETAELDWIATLAGTWRPGRGSPAIGAAFDGQEPVVMVNVSASAPRERAAALRQAGIVASVAVPAVFGDEVLAVLEFLSIDSIDSSDRLMRTLHGIGHEVGHFLARRRGELGTVVLTERELQVLQAAARGLTSEAIAVELHLSGATIKRHFERAYARLGVSDRSAAVAEAMRLGLIS